MAETDIHRDLMFRLIQILKRWFAATEQELAAATRALRAREAEIERLKRELEKK